MASSWKKFIALTRKHLLVISRSPISTGLGAFVAPLLIVFILSFSKTLFNGKDQVFGIGTPSPILTLSDVASEAGARKTVVLCDNGLTGGEISHVIDALRTTVIDAGLQPIYTSNASVINDVCGTTQFSRSKCFGAVLFWSSSTEGPGRIWNYTIGADSSLGGSTNINKNNNDAQVFMLSFQRAIDMQINIQAGSHLQSTVNQLQYTNEDEATVEASGSASYMAAFVNYLVTLFFLAMIPVVYHMTGFIAAEREMGMSALIDATDFSRYGAQLLRLSSTYAALIVIYALSWLIGGIVIGVVVFSHTSSTIIVIFYHLLSGLALCSFSLLSAVFFSKAQLSGVFAVVVTVVLAIVAQLLVTPALTDGAVLALSLLFPSANYIYMMKTIGQWELQGLAANLSEVAPLGRYSVTGATFFGLIAFQIVAYPILAVVIERWLFNTSSKGYTAFTRSEDKDPSVRLSGFSKTYKPSLIKRMFKRRQHALHAVKGLDFEARSGTITMLLGPNGCGKSTTLNAIAGLSKITDGTIEIDRSGGIGFAPQDNVMWNELTVEEHVRIFTMLKSVDGRDIDAEVQALIKGCDLELKTKARAKTLSGGQRRKLQLALMFAGGSKICCVDEVSTGVDPLSRRMIWDILLAKRDEVCLIMTTHFLDEADDLADNIIIMKKGESWAHGSPAELKHRLGNGYSVHVPSNDDHPLPVGNNLITRTESEGSTDYRLSTSAEVAIFINTLESQGIHDYRVTGSTIEHLFLEMVAEDKPKSQLEPSAGEEMQDLATLVPSTESTKTKAQQLLDGKQISVTKQIWFLFRKRLTILRRNWLPYFGALAITLIAAGVAPRIMKYTARPLCPDVQVVEDNSYFTAPFGTYSNNPGSQYVQMVMGPRSQIPDSALQRIVDMYNATHQYYDYYDSVSNLTQLLDSIYFVDTIDEFNNYLTSNYSSTSPGGIFLSPGEAPIIAWLGGGSYYTISAYFVQNMLNILTSPVSIAMAYQPFVQPPSPETTNFPAMVFIVIFGLAFSCYTAFFALYPTAERLGGIRSMQYSNGVQPIALWLAYWAFDTTLVILISAVATVLLAVTTRLWYGLPYMFVVLLFYGTSGIMLSYLVSKVASSPLAAWFISAAIQVVLFFVVLASYLALYSDYPYFQAMDKVGYIQWTLGIISPGANLQRALYVGTGMFALTCGKTGAGSWALYGGPIAYLILQSVLFFSILLLWDSGVLSKRVFGRRRTLKHTASESTPAQTTSTEDKTYIYSNTIERAPSLPSSTGISMSNVTKTFGKNTAVDDISLHIASHPGETFALLGPNGAGKSTIVSLLRADIRPSTSSSSIFIDGTSVLTHRTAARAKIGVCPQFDSSDALTVSESLTFFARIRGVPDPNHNVAAVISICGLTPWANALASTLSGGTRRKLSLAQALVGNPKVLLLDEPSSALDAASKRDLWRVLSALSPGRSILLTTHSMEEAEALADRVGILSARMLAVGTVAELCGDAMYHVHLVAGSAPHTSAEEIEGMLAWVGENVPGARVERKTYAGQVRFSVKASGSGEGEMSVGRLFGLLEAGKEEMGVQWYSVGRTTLDEVFVRVVREMGGREENSY